MTSQGQLDRGEIRYGEYGFYCADGRMHVFHHSFSDGSGTNMDIGPCPGETCPYVLTHGLNRCSCENGSDVCLVGRRITLDRKRRDHDTYIHPMGEGRSRHPGVVHIKDGTTPDWYYQIAQAAETVDGLTSDWPDDWQRRKCESYELGHTWYYSNGDGHDSCHAPDGRGHFHRDDDEPEHIAQATQRRCSSCRLAQTKRANGEWSDRRDDCPCCAEFLSAHNAHYCIACNHEPDNALGPPTQTSPGRLARACFCAPHDTESATQGLELHGACPWDQDATQGLSGPRELFARGQLCARQLRASQRPRPGQA